MEIQKVLSRSGTLEGRPTGGIRPCSMESCTGRRVGVRWEGGSLTWPCSKGMLPISPGVFRIM